MLMFMPTSSPRVADGHRLHPRCKRTCRFLLPDLWATIKLLLPIPSTFEPTCHNNYMLCLHYPVGPMQWPNFAGRSPCALGHTSDMKIWPSIDTPFVVSLSCKSSWVSSWFWLAPSPNSSRYPWSFHYYGVCWRVFPWWSPALESGTYVYSPMP